MVDELLESQDDAIVSKESPGTGNGRRSRKAGISGVKYPVYSEYIHYENHSPLKK